MQLPQSVEWMGNSYDSILVIVNCLIKMVQYEPVQTTIITLTLAKVILNIVIGNHGLPNSIVNNHGLIFLSKFCSSLCYFMSINLRLATAFQPQTDGQIEWQNIKIEAYFRAFVNDEKNNLVRLPPMAEFVYNNAKHASTGYTLFELNCGYHQRVSYKKDVNPCSRSKAGNELTEKLRNLMAAYKKNLEHAQKLQKRAHDKGIKPISYAPSKKIWLKSKCIKNKSNWKLDRKLLEPF